MRWYKDIQIILKKEPEVWLAYLLGKQLNNIAHLTRATPRYRGLFFQLAKFFLHLFRHLSIGQSLVTDKPIKFLVFAGSINQKNSLDTTIQSLRGRGESILAIAPNKFIKNGTGPSRYVPFKYSLSDACKALFFLILRGPSLFRELKSVHPLAMSWYFATFCCAYSYLCYFHRVLGQLRPEFVMTANDHNVSNRCMLAVAHHLGIKTAYLQHASVSQLFPALRVNYAFLDGQSALNVYRECEKNQPCTTRKVPLPMILLTGQKKNIARLGNFQSAKTGVALNPLDDASEAMKFVQNLAEAGIAVRLRWHPGQTERVTKQYLSAFANYPGVSLSDPKVESVSDFMAGVGFLVSGNSSIHLEAALAGVIPIYYELTPPDNPDYYGYVKHGLAELATSFADILQMIKSNRQDHGPNMDAVRYYSATYLSEWDGREGELVAECLSHLSPGGKPSADLMNFIKPFTFNTGDSVKTDESFK